MGASRVVLSRHELLVRLTLQLLIGCLVASLSSLFADIS